MDVNRKLWNQQQQVLQQELKHPHSMERVVELFLAQHAALHASEVSGEVRSGLAWSLDDQLWAGLTEPVARLIPPKFEHSIAWNLWHIARIEDITMNMLVAGADQLLFTHGWQERLHASACDTGSVMDSAEIARLSQEIDLPALRAYRSEVGRQTREVVQRLTLADLKQPVDAAALNRVLEAGAVLPQAGWLVEYWGSHTLGSLLLMPPTRHLLVHLNEAVRIKPKALKVYSGA